jgi:hypothetical protein
MAHITFARLKLYFCEMKIATCIIYRLNEFVHTEMLELVEPFFKNIEEEDLLGRLSEYRQYTDLDKLTLKMVHTTELIRDLKRKYKHVDRHISKDILVILQQVVLQKLEDLLRIVKKFTRVRMGKLVTLTIVNLSIQDFIDNDPTI